MVLSSGTLNLKFMQRAAARQAATASPSTSSSPGPSSQPSRPSQYSTPGPSRLALPASVTPETPQAGPSRSLDQTSSIQKQAQLTPTTSISTPAVPAASAASYDQDTLLSRAEEEARWVIPTRRIQMVPGEADADASVVKEEQWTFEPGYMSFLTSSSSETQAGGGRMAFGGFGKAQETEKEDDAQDDMDPAQDEDEAEYETRRSNNISNEQRQKKRSRPSSPDTPETSLHPGKRVFLRPAGFDTPERSSTSSPIPATSSSSRPSRPERSSDSSRANHVHGGSHQDYGISNHARVQASTNSTLKSRTDQRESRGIGSSSSKESPKQPKMSAAERLRATISFARSKAASILPGRQQPGSIQVESDPTGSVPAIPSPKKSKGQKKREAGTRATQSSSSKPAQPSSPSMNGSSGPDGRGHGRSASKISLDAGGSNDANAGGRGHGGRGQTIDQREAEERARVKKEKKAAKKAAKKAHESTERA